MTVSKVFIRAVGCKSALGDSWRATATALARGQSAIAQLERFADFPCTVAAEIAEDTGDTDRRVAFALAAAGEAWEQAALDVPAERLGVFVGAEAGRPSFAKLIGMVRDTLREDGALDHQRLATQAAPLAYSLAPRRTSPAAPAAAIAKAIGAGGPVRTVSLACASGSAAIAEAVRAIRSGACDVALAGGVGADVDRLMVAGFSLLGALSHRGSSRPFDVHRDGFVVGEGAAMMVLAREPADAACAVSGIGRSLDAWRLTAPEPQGRGAERAMRRALADAQIEQVDYVQAHGTSTPLNDAVEAAALRRIFGDALDAGHVSSVKGALGHWIAGAGALGALCAYEAICSGNVLPTAGLQHADPDCRLPHVTDRAAQAEIRTALVNAFAFGGANCSLVLEAA